MDARKVKTIVAQSTSYTGVVLQMYKETLAPLLSAVEYYWTLRTLGYAWAFAGNYVTKDSDGAQKKMIGLTESINYADLSLRNCMEFGGGSLAWYERNGKLTRGKMASLVRRGDNACTAQAAALQETHLELPPARVLASEVSTPEPKRRLPDMPELATPARAARVQTVSMAEGGRTFCKPYNDGFTIPRHSRL